MPKKVSDAGLTLESNILDPEPKYESYSYGPNHMTAQLNPPDHNLNPKINGLSEDKKNDLEIEEHL